MLSILKLSPGTLGVHMRYKLTCVSPLVLKLWRGWRARCPNQMIFLRQTLRIFKQKLGNRSYNHHLPMSKRASYGRRQSYRVSPESSSHTGLAASVHKDARKLCYEWCVSCDREESKQQFSLWLSKGGSKTGWESSSRGVLFSVDFGREAVNDCAPEDHIFLPKPVALHKI